VADFGVPASGSTPGKCNTVDNLVKMSLRDYIEKLATVSPFIATDYNLNPYWPFYAPPKKSNGEIIRWNFYNIKT
jgi:hypothetical protein